MAQHTNGEGSSPRTAYLGPEASFSHQAVVETLPNTQPCPLPSFRAIFSAIQQSTKRSPEAYDYAVLPVENSTNGSVVQALDLLAQCRLDPQSSYQDVEVFNEHYLEVHHCLFVSRVWAEQRLTEKELSSLESGEDLAPDRDGLEKLLTKLSIKTIHTHPQVWGQCDKFLSTLLPPASVDRVDMSSTSAAAAYITTHPSNIQDGQTDSGIVAISSSLAGAKHGRDLICLAKNIEDEPGANTTRFLLLRNRILNQSQTNPPHYSDTLTETNQVKSLWMFTIEHHVPGSLAEALAIFAKHGFNLSAIQSRPKPKLKNPGKVSNGTSTPQRQTANWQYVFFAECLHTPRNVASMRSQDEIEGLIQELRTHTDRLVLLGSWLAV